MKLNSRAQTAIELVLVTGALLYFFIIFLGAIQTNTQERTRTQTNLALEEIVLTLDEEIKLATDSKDGYVRNFTLPEKISYTKEYTIQINEDFIYAISTDEKNSYGKATLPVQGQPEKGNNQIKKINGIVYLN